MESNKCVMVAKAADAGLKEEGGEDEVELDLGLSIGGSYRRPAERDVCVQNGSGSGLQKNVEREMDQRMKREIHALRRQEAKRKREEKQLKRSVSCKTKGSSFDAESFQRECKKSKSEDHSGSDDHFRLTNPVNLNLGLPVHYPNPYQPLQNGPAANGSLDENVMMTCWLPGGVAGIGPGRNVVQPVVRFGPLNKAGSEPGCNSVNRNEAEQITSRDGGSRDAGSNGSSNLCTSSAGSDRKSSSFEGGGSSDSRSYSGQSVPEQPQLNSSKANNANSLPDYSATSHLKDLARVNGIANHVEKLVPQNHNQSSPSGPGERTKSEKNPTDKHTSTVGNPAAGLLREGSGSMSKPPKPQTPNHIAPPSLPHMPCVSTTGNGPNGKTINGFLYRYTKSEVSIICVCHGSSFSPAEFVQHAGGTDVSHPLRHITVIPSAF